nr:integrase, catalytic region, zinc finger, CCHC-type, peptidase aspartic, catalytic [Tanacetum cinerariifolium]
MAGLLFRLFRVDRIEVRGSIPGEQLQLEMGEFRIELAMLILTNTFNDGVDEAPVQDLELNKDNVFQADQCNAFDFDVDEAPNARTMFMENLSSADPINDDAGPSYDSNILSESALYNDHEIVKTNYALAVVHDLEDTLEVAEITRKRMLEKVKTPLCVEKKFKIAPPDYSKENYLATFIPQRHLTSE